MVSRPGRGGDEVDSPRETLRPSPRNPRGPTGAEGDAEVLRGLSGTFPSEPPAGPRGLEAEPGLPEGCSGAILQRERPADQAGLGEAGRARRPEGDGNSRASEPQVLGLSASCAWVSTGQPQCFVCKTGWKQGLL